MKGPLTDCERFSQTYFAASARSGYHSN
jgi:hypothetical protein